MGHIEFVIMKKNKTLTTGEIQRSRKAIMISVFPNYSWKLLLFLKEISHATFLTSARSLNSN